MYIFHRVVRGEAMRFIQGQEGYRRSAFGQEPSSATVRSSSVWLPIRKQGSECAVGCP